LEAKEHTRRSEMLALMNAPHNTEVVSAADLSSDAVDPQGGETLRLTTLRAVAPKAQAEASRKCRRNGRPSANGQQQSR